VNDKLISTISGLIVERFEAKKSYFSKFVKLDTGPEEWFRVEILDVLSDANEFEILATNQIFKDLPGRPDIVIKYANKNHIVELKVLPTDRNYNSGYQRFCAGKANKADFDGLVNGEVDLIIYIHWPSNEDFMKTKAKLHKRYHVSCPTVQKIKFNNGICSISFWQKSV